MASSINTGHCESRYGLCAGDESFLNLRCSTASAPTMDIQHSTTARYHDRTKALLITRSTIVLMSPDNPFVMAVMPPVTTSLGLTSAILSCRRPLVRLFTNNACSMDTNIALDLSARCNGMGSWGSEEFRENLRANRLHEHDHTRPHGDILKRKNLLSDHDGSQAGKA